MTFFLSFLGSSVGRIAILCLACFLAGCFVTWRLCHRTSRRATVTVQVTGALNGATLQAEAGWRGRRTRLIHLEGVAAPGLEEPHGHEAAANLQKLAGGSVRVESIDGRRLGLVGDLVGVCYGEAGSNLCLEQLRAGLATCESTASAEFRAAQQDAQRAKRGVWETKTDGSHWWHFGVLSEDLEQSEEEENPMVQTLLQNLGTWLEIGVLAIVVLWLVWSYVKPLIAAKSPSAAAAIGTAIDVTEQIASYTALSAVRRDPRIVADPKALESIDYARTVCTQWTTLPAAAKTA